MKTTQPSRSSVPEDLHDDTVKSTVYTGIRKATVWMLGIILLLGFLSINLQEESWSIPLERIDWFLLLLGWCFMVGTMWILGLRWRVLLPNTRASRSFFGASLSAGLLINYALPGPMGEFMGGWLLKREDNTPIVEGLTASTLARLLGLFTAAVGSVVLWWWIDIEVPMAQNALQILMFGIGCGGILLIILSLKSAVIADNVRLSNKDPHHPLSLVSASLTQIHNLSLTQIIRALLYSAMGHSTAFIGIWLSLLAIGGSPNPIDIAFVYLVGTCCGTVAFLFPGSQFTWDAIFIGLLISTAEYSTGSATIATGILRIEQLAMMLFGAAPLSWILWRQGQRSHET